MIIIGLLLPLLFAYPTRGSSDDTSSNNSTLSSDENWLSNSGGIPGRSWPSSSSGIASQFSDTAASNSAAGSLAGVQVRLGDPTAGPPPIPSRSVIERESNQRSDLEYFNYYSENNGFPNDDFETVRDVINFNRLARLQHPINNQRSQSSSSSDSGAGLNGDVSVRTDMADRPGHPKARGTSITAARFTRVPPIPMRQSSPAAKGSKPKGSK